MKILLISATELEIKPFIEKHKELLVNISTGKHFEYFSGGDPSFDIVITGTGIARSTFYITEALHKKEYDLVVQAGICGSFTREIAIGEVVETTEEIFAQTGAEDGADFVDVFDLGLEDRDTFPFSNGILKNINAGTYNLSQLIKVKGITVETTHGNTASIEKIIRKYNPDVETMEGASLFLWCLIKNIPFIQIRSVSNFIEKRNKENWNIPLAIENLNAFLISMMEDIKQ